MIRSAYSFLLKARSALFALGARCSEKVKSPSTSLESRLSLWSGKLKKPTASYRRYGLGFPVSSSSYVELVRRRQRTHLRHRSWLSQSETPTPKFSRCKSFTKSALNLVSSLTSSKRSQTITKTWNSLRSLYIALSKTMQGRLSSA